MPAIRGNKDISFRVRVFCANEESREGEPVNGRGYLFGWIWLKDML